MFTSGYANTENVFYCLSWKRRVFRRFGLPSTLIRGKPSPKTHLLKKRSPLSEWRFLKTPLSCTRADGWKLGFEDDYVTCWIQSISRTRTRWDRLGSNTIKCACSHQRWYRTKTIQKRNVDKDILENGGRIFRFQIKTKTLTRPLVHLTISFNFFYFYFKPN